jgi:hypothetical protein
MVQFLAHDPDLSRSSHQLAVRHWLTEPWRMQSVAAAADWDLLPIESIGILADWLGLTSGELARLLTAKV